MNIELDDDQALVLFELIADFSSGEGDPDHLKLSHPAERNALWLLHGAIEKILVAPFQDDYAEQLKRSRARLMERCGT